MKMIKLMLKLAEDETLEKTKWGKVEGGYKRG